MATPTTHSPMAALDDGSLSRSAPAAYAGVSVRQLWDRLKDPAVPEAFPASEESGA